MIEVKDLCKDYGPIKAVNHVNFKVEKGDVLAFLGPNGAGKSTTIKMISGFVKPSSGEVLINNEPLEKNEIRSKKKIGYMPESTPSYGELTVEEFLNFVAESYGLSSRKDKVDEVIAMTNLEEVRHQLIETLSKGYQSRLSFASAIIHDPEMLLLDEPTDGLDPNQKNELRNLIKKLSKDKAIIVSTHILEEVEAMCNKVIVISEGKIVLDGTPDDFREKAEGKDLDAAFRKLTKTKE